MKDDSKSRKTQLQRKEEAIQKIVEAALDLISVKGTFAVTMAEIGIHAGYSRGLPYQHFGTKEKLIEVILDSLINKFNERRKKHTAPSPGLDSIKSLIHTYLDREEEDWNATKALIIMMAEASLQESKQRELIVLHNRKNIEFLKKHLQIAKEEQHIKANLNNNDLAVIIMGALRGTVLQTLSDKSIDINSVRNSLLKIIDTVLIPSATTEIIS